MQNEEYQEDRTQILETRSQYQRQMQWLCDGIRDGEKTLRCLLCGFFSPIQPLGGIGVWRTQARSHYGMNDMPSGRADIRAQSWITPAPTVQQMAINSLSPFKPSFHNSAFTVWNKRSVSHIVVWSQCKGELGALSRVLASVKTSLWSFLHLPIFWIESEPGVVGPESRKLGAPGVSSASESSSSVRSFSALEVGRILLALGVVGSSVGSGESWGLPSCVGVFCCGGGVYPFHPWLIWACRFQVWGGRLQHLLLHLCFILFCSCKGFCEAIDDDGSYADRYASHVFLSLFKSNNMCYSVVNTSFHDKEDRYMYYESLTLNDEFFLLGDRSPSLSSTLFIHLTQTLPYINNPEKNE